MKRGKNRNGVLLIGEDSGVKVNSHSEIGEACSDNESSNLSPSIVRTKLKSFSTNIREKNQLATQVIDKQYENGKKKIKEVTRKLVTGDKNKRVRDYIKEPSMVKWMDKWAFTFGVLNLIVSEFILTSRPQYFWSWYLLMVPTMISMRVPKYKKQGFFYFLFDFCYFTQLLCIIQIAYAYFIDASPCRLLRLNFLLTNGPVAWAVISWRNSLVFHDLDRITTLYIHIFPALLLFTFKWFNQIGGYNIQGGTFSKGMLLVTDVTTENSLINDNGLYYDNINPNKGYHDLTLMAFERLLKSFRSYEMNFNETQELLASLSEYIYFAYLDASKVIVDHHSQCHHIIEAMTYHDVINASTVYLFWQILYLFKTEFLDKKLLDENEKLYTSLRWLSTDSKNALHQMTLTTCRALRIMRKDEIFDFRTFKTKFIFVLTQFLYTFAGIICAMPLYSNFYLHCLYGIIIFSWSTYNGATYYIDVFARRYIASVDKVTTEDDAPRDEHYEPPPLTPQNKNAFEINQKKSE